MKATTILLCIALCTACAPLQVWTTDSNPNDGKLPGLPVLVPDTNKGKWKIVYVNARPGLFGTSSLTANIDKGILTTLTVNSAPSEKAVGGIVDLASTAVKPPFDPTDSAQRWDMPDLHAELTELRTQLNTLIQQIESMD